MSALSEVLRSLSGILDERGLGWFVFGAQAVAVRGAARATQDLDVTIEIDRADLPELFKALEAEGFCHRYPDIAGELLSSGAVLPLTHPTGMEIDIVLAGSGLEALTLSRATRISVAGVEVPVAQATDLVVMKVLAGRGKDMEDVRSLLASGDVDIPEVMNLLAQLEEALDQSDLLSALQGAIKDVER